jgi:DNA polymerase-4
MRSPGHLCQNEPVSLNALYVDLNSFFASAEQQMQPALRGRPIGVLPVMAETTCCIAASIQAKRFGIRTGTPVHEARRRCREIIFVEARPAAYVALHHAIVAAVNGCYPVSAVLSIDEMALDLTGRHRQTHEAIALGRAIKAAIYREVGSELHCSIGIAPNRFLAKTASNFTKPDGLEIIHPEDLPTCLYRLPLRALTGIGEAMAARLEHLGIDTVEKLYAARKETLRLAWGGIEGERFHARLRGEVVAPVPTRRATVSHSHVLPPERRNPVDAQAILFRLLHKAAMRLRHYDCVAGALAVHVSSANGRRWQADCRFSAHQNTLAFNQQFATLWTDYPPALTHPLKVGVVLSSLCEKRAMSLDLFASPRAGRLNQALDRINLRYGPNTLFFGSADRGRGNAPMRIAFNHVPEPDLEQDG